MKRKVSVSTEGSKSYLIPAFISCFCLLVLQMCTRFFKKIEVVEMGKKFSLLLSYFLSFKLVVVVKDRLELWINVKNF